MSFVGDLRGGEGGGGGGHRERHQVDGFPGHRGTAYVPRNTSS